MYFDSNRIKEYDTVSFSNEWDAGANYKWTITDKSGVICYTYRIGFPDIIYSGYDFPTQDSLQRIWISNKERFMTAFPLNINLPNRNIDMILNKQGLVDVKDSWINNDYDKNNDELYKSMKQSFVFFNENPFDYFKSRSDIMNGLGVNSISRHSWGNVITIKLNSSQGYLDYLPNVLSVESRYRHMFDSVIATSFKIDKNWIWRKKVVAK